MWKLPQCPDRGPAMGAEVCLGLYVLHTNKILHRDIKAANIFVGENDRIMLGDLGIAKLAKSEGLAAKTQIGALVHNLPRPRWPSRGLWHHNHSDLHINLEVVAQGTVQRERCALSILAQANLNCLVSTICTVMMT